MRRCKCSPVVLFRCALRLACTPLQTQRGPNPKPDSLLDAELGTGLFDRVPRGMRLNMAGERLQQHVRATLHDFHLMAPSSTRSRVGAGAMCRWLRWTRC